MQLLIYCVWERERCVRGNIAVSSARQGHIWAAYIWARNNSAAACAPDVMIPSVILGPLGFWNLSLPLFPALSSLLRSAYFRIKHYKVLCWPLWGQRVMTCGTRMCTDDLTPGERMKPFGSKQTSCQGEQPPLALKFLWAVNLKTCQTHTNWITALQWALFSLLMFPSSRVLLSVQMRCGCRCWPHVVVFSQTLPLPVPLPLAHSFIFHCCFLSLR